MADVCELMMKAIAMAEERQAFYQSDACETANALAAKTFESLASWEGEHIELLRSVYDTAEATNSCPMLGGLDATQRDMMAACETIFADATAGLSDDVEEDTSVGGAYAEAMRMERDAIKFFTGLVDEAQNEIESELYGFMLNQERDKLNLLATTEEYLNDTAYWNFKNEMWIVTG